MKKQIRCLLGKLLSVLLMAALMLYPAVQAISEPDEPEECEHSWIWFPISDEEHRKMCELCEWGEDDWIEPHTWSAWYTDSAAFAAACGTADAGELYPATCTEDGVQARFCTKCHAFATGVAKASHSWDTEWSSDETKHWHKCTACTATADEAEHTAAEDAAVPAACTTDGLTAGSHCSVCGKVLVAQEVVPASHSWDTEWSSDETKHWHQCTACTATADEAEHTVEEDPAVPATCTTDGLTAGSHCSVCGKVLVAQEVVPASHSWKTEWSSDGTKHWHQCTACTAIQDEAEHTAKEDPAVAATCTTEGLTAGSHCSVCGYTIVSQTVVPVTEHTPAEPVNETSIASKDGKPASHDAVVYCTGCGQELGRTAIYEVMSFKDASGETEIIFYTDGTYLVKYTDGATETGKYITDGDVLVLMNDEDTAQTRMVFTKIDGKDNFGLKFIPSGDSGKTIEFELAPADIEILRPSAFVESKPAESKAAASEDSSSASGTGVVATPQIIVGGKVYKSTVSGAFITKDITIAVVAPKADLASKARLGAGESLYFKGWEFTAKQSPLAYQALTDVAGSIGGNVLQCVELNFGKMTFGKFSELDESVVARTTISLPKKADKNKKHALARAAKGGKTQILENFTEDPNVITSDIPGGAAAYAIVEY